MGKEMKSHVLSTMDTFSVSSGVVEFTSFVVLFVRGSPNLSFAGNFFTGGTLLSDLAG